MRHGKLTKETVHFTTAKMSCLFLAANTCFSLLLKSIILPLEMMQRMSLQARHFAMTNNGTNGLTESHIINEPHKFNINFTRSIYYSSNCPGKS